MPHHYWDMSDMSDPGIKSLSSCVRGDGGEEARKGRMVRQREREKH
jgi:hypothetical protein